MLANRDIWQHAVIDELPKYLKKELVRHLYAKQHANRVPVFAFDVTRVGRPLRMKMVQAWEGM